MKKFGKFLKSPAAIVVLFVAAAALILTGGIGGTRAALTDYSNTYLAQVETSEIGVALLENGAVAEELFAGGTDIAPGKEYAEELAVRNTSDIDTYVRVSLYKYWVDPDGKKVADPSADTIEFAFGDAWLEDEDSATDERTVLYYPEILAAGDDSEPFVTAVTVDAKELTKKVTETGTTTITTTYTYDGYSFVVEANVDAVQTHNADDAMLSAWGKTLSDIQG